MPDKVTETERIHDDHLNDNSSWGSSEFEDETIEESRADDDSQQVVKPSLIRNKQAILLSQNNKIPGSLPAYAPRRAVATERDEIYVNYENYPNPDEGENIYKNCEEAKAPPTKNISKLHGQLENSLASKLKEELEQLKRRNQKQEMKKPVMPPKPEALSKKVPTITDNKNFPRKSFLHDPPKPPERVPTAPTDQSKPQS